MQANSFLTVVVGRSGSGKTTYLNQQAKQFLGEFLEGEVFFCDILSDNDEELTKINTPTEILATIKYVAETLIDRVSRDKREPRILLICDEFDRLLASVSSFQAQEIGSAINLINHNGKKHGVSAIFSAQAAQTASFVKRNGCFVEKISF